MRQFSVKQNNVSTVVHSRCKCSHTTRVDSMSIKKKPTPAVYMTKLVARFLFMGNDYGHEGWGQTPWSQQQKFFFSYLLIKFFCAPLMLSVAQVDFNCLTKAGSF